MKTSSPLKMFLIRRVAPIALLAAALTPLGIHAQPAQPVPPSEPVPSLAGTWTLLPDLSTDLTPWKTLDLTIAIAGPSITIKDSFAAGARAIDTVAQLDLSRPVSLVPIPWWADNRHIGAYIGGDRTERVRARWVDDQRILRTEGDLVLDTQQGSRAVNILTDYQISPSGNQLTVIQLRSTREVPIVYVFKRVSP